MTVVRRLAWFSFAALFLGCAGETTRPSSPNQGSNMTSVTGAGASGGTGSPCTGVEPYPDPARVFANWNMPHPPSSRLPNPAKYDTSQSAVVIDDVTGLMWSRTGSPIDEELSFDGAVSYCAESEAGGYCDWRLPTRIELVSLVDFTRAAPAINPEVFSDFPEAPQERLGWSFFTSSTTETTEWWVMFIDGASVPIARGSAVQGARARCVRLHVQSEPPESRYLIEGEAPDDIVTDRGSGLTWQRRPSQQTFPFSEAQAYCSSLALRGTGWRVPSMKELQTIVDEGRTSPALDPEVFPDYPAPDAFFRTSSTSAGCSDCAWLMRPDGSSFETGVNTGLNAHHYVRCVRPGDGS